MINQTAERLKRLSPAIMELWVERTLEEVKASNLQETLALKDSLPIYLNQLSDALSKTLDRSDARIKSDSINSERIGRKHGGERAVAEEYTMDQMILEYHILRQVICDEMEKEAILTPVEHEVIVCSIEQAVNDAATQFSDTLREFQDELAYTLVHDLRNPLSTVKMSAQVLARQVTDSVQKEWIHRILISTERIDDMIQELLDKSSANASAKQFELKELDLNWLVNDIAYEMNITNPDRFKVESEGYCTGMWNENILRRLIENLVTNAIKYGTENSPVTLSLSQTNSTAVLKVHNFGNPIPKEDTALLFEKFNRGHAAIRKIGWGIGLTVVKTFVDAHHGTIEIESDKDIGTTFIVTLPKYLQDEKREEFVH